MRGNHDQLLCDWLNESKDNLLWYKHGGESTVLAYAKLDDKTKKNHVAFLQSLQNYYLDDLNRLFVHAGFTNMNGVNFEHFPKNVLLGTHLMGKPRCRLTKILPYDSTLYPRRLKLYDEIYIGHTPVTQIGKTVPTQMANVWNVDTGAAFKGPLTVLDVDTKEYWQSDALPDLYPTEKGRN